MERMRADNISDRCCADNNSDPRKRQPRIHGNTPKKTRRVKKPQQEKQTHDMCGRHIKPTLLTSADNSQKFFVDLRFTGMAGVYKPPCSESSLHIETNAPTFDQQSGSTRGLDELLRDEMFKLCFSRIASSSEMHVRPVRINI